ncbi:MAG: shikimate kinase [bacterium]|nr:MAG: shikimate kinase [bacterium]
MLSTSRVKSHVILIGYRGVGKTTIGQLLGARLQCPFRDSDTEIVNDTGLSIPQIFKEHGEDYFRRIEQQVIQRLCQVSDPIILSTGGGAVLSSVNRELMKKYGTIVLLKASEDIIFQRIHEDLNRPPLTSHDLKKEIREVLKIRNPLYQGIKDLAIDTESYSPNDAVTAILEYIH